MSVKLNDEICCFFINFDIIFFVIMKKGFDYFIIVMEIDYIFIFFGKIICGFIIEIGKVK